MGKRSDFERIARDKYPTVDPRAVEALLPAMQDFGVKTFFEPCAGMGHLIRLIEPHGPVCVGASDIDGCQQEGIDERDALDLTPALVDGADAIITNPPWERDTLHCMIRHFASLKRTFLLFDADWMHTAQAAPYMELCERVISVGRLKWFENTTMQGKDNCAWYVFQQRPETILPRFVPRPVTPRQRVKFEGCGHYQQFERGNE